MSIKHFFTNQIPPVDFSYGGKSILTLLPGWTRSQTKTTCSGYDFHTITYTERPAQRLKVIFEIKYFTNGQAADWKMLLENIGTQNTERITNIASASLHLAQPLQDGSYLLHRFNGGLSNKEDHLPGLVRLQKGDSFRLETYGGRSTNKDNAYFTLDSGHGRMIAAIGWTGQWKCDFRCDSTGLTLNAGLSAADFTLYPGEQIALPSIVMLLDPSCSDKAWNQFRKLVLNYYVPQLPGRNKDPYLICNTCFTRGGGWLEECNEENQISLLHALSGLGTECVITDAGWFPGQTWMQGIGNWVVDPLKYPNGIEAVTRAAKQHNMRYGLWFELERVWQGRPFAVEHPELMLHYENWPVMLADLGQDKTVDYMYEIVERFLKIENFTCYRQDYNVEPFDFWQAADTPGRIGITEIKYINGLYKFLDRIRINYPGVFMDGCASGGRRLDIEMIKRFHTNQKTDYWFDNTNDQNSLYALSYYLPNVCVTAHTNRYDDYSFCSAMPATLCLGWIADSQTEGYQDIPPYRPEIGKKLTDIFHKLAPLFNQDFYPLTEFDPSDTAVQATQYLNEREQLGVVLVYKRPESQNTHLTLCLKYIEQACDYTLTDLFTNQTTRVSGKQLASGYTLALGDAPQTQALYFEKFKTNQSHRLRFI